ncbi:MAG TPA: hypothetical protein ENN69_00820 [Spirochaetia bacterium]|nr:hypothetical protein [Spirochaetia bacterium]
MTKELKERLARNNDEVRLPVAEALEECAAALRENKKAVQALIEGRHKLFDRLAELLNAMPTDPAPRVSRESFELFTESLATEAANLAAVVRPRLEKLAADVASAGPRVDEL